MTLSQKTVVFGALVCLIVLAVPFCRSRFQHLGELHNYALPMSDDSVEEHMLSRENRLSFTVTNVQSSNSTNWLLAVTDPQQDVFRNEMTFRNSQGKLNHRHAPSERAYNRGGCKSMLTLKILDDEGNPISGVPIHVHPMLNWKHLSSFSSCTDKNGIACLKHSDANSYVISITKVGYYDIYGTIQFFSHHYVCIILDGPIGEFRKVSANSAQLFMECYVNPEPGNRVIESEVLLRK